MKLAKIFSLTVLPAVAFGLAMPPAAAQTGLATGPGIASQGELREIARQAERLSDSFRKNFDRALDRSIIDGTKKEKKFEKQAEQLENALDDVNSAVRDGKKYKDTRKRVKRALKYAQKLDRVMPELRLNPEVEGEWWQLLVHLDQLARFHELPPIGRGSPVTVAHDPR